MTPDEAVAIWGILAEANPGQPMSETTVRIRAELILDLDFEEAKAAAIALAKSSRWTPGVAEFRAAVLCPALPTPDEVWEELLSLIPAHHPDVSAPSQDEMSPAAWQVLRTLGGWRAFCTGDERVDRAHVLKEIAPRVIERIRRNVLVAPGLPELIAPTSNPFALPEADE